MRKRNIVKIADTIFWYVVYLLPIILTLIQASGIFANFGLADWENIADSSSMSGLPFINLLYYNLGVLGAESGLIVDTLRAIFSDEGILFMFDASVIFSFAQWFVGCLLIHLCVDFILAIPRIAHKWLDDFAKGE